MALVNQQSVVAQEPFKGPYGNMKFPPYTFREFPKVVGKDQRGKEVIAQDRGEEQVLLARGDIEVQISRTDDAEKSLLRAQVAEEQAKNVAQGDRISGLEDKLNRLLGLMEAKTKAPFPPKATQQELNDPPMAIANITGAESTCDILHADPEGAIANAHVQAKNTGTGIYDTKKNILHSDGSIANKPEFDRRRAEAKAKIDEILTKSNEAKLEAELNKTEILADSTAAQR